MNEIVMLFLEKICEAIYFSLFLILGKNLQKKRVLFTTIMIVEYLLLKQFIHYNIWFQLMYTFMTFVNLKVLYREKAQITDIFLFATASLILMIICGFSYALIYFTIKKYIVSLLLPRILICIFFISFRNKINNLYKKFYSLWNRNSNSKIRSLTLRNISIIGFNLMFYIINIGLSICLLLGKR